MNINIGSSMKRVVILDVSGVYIQIYDQGYFDCLSINKIEQQYSDTKHWKVLILDD